MLGGPQMMNVYFIKSLLFNVREYENKSIINHSFISHKNFVLNRGFRINKIPIKFTQIYETKVLKTYTLFHLLNQIILQKKNGEQIQYF